jgi:phospholipid N-methyltransferase
MTTAAKTPPRRSTMRDRARFFGEFVRNPLATASIAPSSPQLARAMIRGLDFAKVRSIVEYGPGSGAFTTAVCHAVTPAWFGTGGAPGQRSGAGVYIAIEFSAALADLLREKHPEVHVVHDSAEFVERICSAHAITPGELDCVLSGLGWVSLPKDLITRMLEATHRTLRDGGEFRTFGYHVGLLWPGAWHFRAEIKRLFRQVEVSRVVWANLPPAFVYRCVK